MEKDVSAFWRMFLQTEEIMFHADILLPKDVCRTLDLQCEKLKHKQFWMGYLKCLKDVGVEVLGISKSRFEDELDFGFKLRIARRLQQKYPDSQIGFVCGAVHYSLAEIDGLEGLRNLYSQETTT